MDILTITLTAHDGTPGVDRDAANPLARALNRLLRTGKPFERLHACYFDPLPMASGIRWFGVFVISEAGRVVYFPGLTQLHDRTFTSRGTETITRRKFTVDHLSLQADRKSWHLTGTGTKPHVGKYSTTDLGNGRVLWFGMSVASPDVLRRLHVNTDVEAHVPSGDSRRRGEVLMDARDGIVFNTVLFSELNRKLVVPSFAHFYVIAGPCGFPAFRGSVPGLPIGSPYVSPPLLNLSELPLRIHRISLEPHVDLDVVTMILPGSVTVPAALTSP